MNLCKYKGIFGDPGVGVHKKRIPILNIAFIDTLFTFIGAWIIYKYFKFKSYWKVLGVVFIIGIIVHRLFCVNTQLNKMLGLEARLK